MSKKLFRQFRLHQFNDTCSKRIPGVLFRVLVIHCQVQDLTLSNCTHGQTQTIRSNGSALCSALGVSSFVGHHAVPMPTAVFHLGKFFASLAVREIRRRLDLFQAVLGTAQKTLPLWSMTIQERNGATHTSLSFTLFAVFSQHTCLHIPVEGSRRSAAVVEAACPDLPTWLWASACFGNDVADREQQHSRGSRLDGVLHYCFILHLWKIFRWWWNS